MASETVVVRTPGDRGEAGGLVQRKAAVVVVSHLKQDPVRTSSVCPVHAQSDQSAGDAALPPVGAHYHTQDLGGVVQHTETGDGFDLIVVPADQHKPIRGAEFGRPGAGAPAFRGVEPRLLQL